MGELTVDVEGFLAGVQDPALRQRWRAVPALGEALRAAWLEVRKARPEVRCEQAAFLRHVAARWPAAIAPDAGLSALSLVDLYLVCAYLRGDTAAAAVLERGYLRRVPAMLAGLDLSEAQRDAVVDQVREKLLLPREGGALPGIAAYGGRGALMEWLRIVAVRTALHLVKRVGERLRADEEDALPWLGDDPALRYVKGLDAPVFAAAVREAFAGLEAAQRVLLRLYYMDGLGQEQIATALGIHKTTVSRRLEAARRAVAEGTRRRLGERLALSGEGVDSLAAFVHSQLDLSLGGLLRDANR